MFNQASGTNREIDNEYIIIDFLKSTHCLQKNKRKVTYSYICIMSVQEVLTDLYCNLPYDESSLLGHTVVYIIVQCVYYIDL